MVLSLAATLTMVPTPPVCSQEAGSSAQEPINWSLADAVSFAIDNNPEIQLVEQRIASAAAMVDSAASLKKPSVSLVGEYTQTNTPMYSFGNILNQGSFSDSINFNDPGRTDDLLLQAGIEYRVYDGGERQAGIEEAEAGHDAVRNRLAALHKQLAFEVVKAYHSIQKAQEMLSVRDAAVEAIDASLNAGRARYEAGDLLKEDLLNLELQKARALENRIRSRHELDLAERIFWNLLGISNELSEALPTHADKQNVPDLLDSSRRIELQVIESRIDAAEAVLARARSSKRPDLDSFARYQVEHGTITGESGDSWLAGVRLSYSLYNGHRTEAEIIAAQSGIAEMKADREKLKLALSLELQKARITYQQSLERMQVTAKMVEVAKESAELSRIRFQEGIILASDLIDMEMRLTDALARRAAARAENKIAVANLRRATGADQFPERDL